MNAFRIPDGHAASPETIAGNNALNIAPPMRALENFFRPLFVNGGDPSQGRFLGGK
jgi:hypothetical protein